MHSERVKVASGDMSKKKLAALFVTVVLIALVIGAFIVYKRFYTKHEALVVAYVKT